MYSKLLKTNETVSADNYSQQYIKQITTNIGIILNNKRPQIANKRRKMIFCTPYVTKSVKTVIGFLKEVLLLSAYSPDIVSSDYYLCRLMQDVFHTYFQNVEEAKN